MNAKQDKKQQVVKATNSIISKKALETPKNDKLSSKAASDKRDSSKKAPNKKNSSSKNMSK